MSSRDRREVWQLDVFTTELYQGNPAAIVFDAQGLTDQTMQAIARETNLSETVFLLPPGDPLADYRVRMFTPRSEMMFAGHPTIAVAAAQTERILRTGGKVPEILRQECGIGIIPIEVSVANGGYLFKMTQANPTWRDASVSIETAAQMLELTVAEVCEMPIQVVSTGVPWLIIPLRSPQAVSAARPDLRVIERVCREHGAVGLTTYAIGTDSSKRWVKVRTFAPGEGVPEDPVCGSGNGSVAAYIAGTALGDSTFDYEAAQGAEVCRPGRVWVQCRPSKTGLEIKVGGTAVCVMKGHICV
jgi:PhzF family phenazine biosynthesis protein